MESATPATQDVSRSELNVVLALIFAFLATLQVSIAVVGQWGTYGWVKMTLAILLIVNILMLPVQLFTKKGRMSASRPALTLGLTFGYIWVMLATLVFNRL